MEFLQIYLAINFFIIGALFGSFFSLATYRLPRKQDIVCTRSYCPTCKHNLAFFDLIPILSYIFHGGKCKYCKEKISKRYLILELSNALIFTFVFLLFGFTLKTLIVLIIYITMFLIIGTNVMRSKMTEQELLEVNSKGKEKLNNKKGVFISELIIAMILFAVFTVSAIVTMKNYTKSSLDTVAKSAAVNIATKNMEIALATKYDNLDSFSNTQTFNDISYDTTVDVIKYSDENIGKEDVVKKIEVTVNYIVSGEEQSFSVTSLKERES